MKGRLLCRRVLDLAFPRGPCALCGETGPPGPAPSLCGRCWRQRRKLGPPRCALCGTPFPEGGTAEGACGKCLADPPPFVAHTSPYAYAGPVRALLLLYKDERRYPLARLLGRALGRSVLGMWKGLEFDLIVPTPSPLRRRMVRGFEPAGLIAGEAGRFLGIPVARALHLRRATAPQKDLTEAQRLTNLRGAFRADARRVKGKRILLVDDITTTGATLREGAKVLARSGAEVYAATVAMALRRDLDLGIPADSGEGAE